MSTLEKLRYSGYELRDGFKERASLLAAKFRVRLLNFGKDESGMGTIEIVLIIIVLVGLVAVFQKQIKGLVGNVIGQIVKDAEGIYK